MTGSETWRAWPTNPFYDVLDFGRVRSWVSRRAGVADLDRRADALNDVALLTVE